MVKTRSQTKGCHAHGSLGLSGCSTYRRVLSPYYQMKHCTVTEGRMFDSALRMQTGRVKHNLVTMIKSFIIGYQSAGSGVDVNVFLLDSEDINTICISLPMTITGSDTGLSVQDQIEQGIEDYCIQYNIPIPSEIHWMVATPKSLADSTSGIPRVALVSGTVAGGSGEVSIDISSYQFDGISHVVWEGIDDSKVFTFGNLSSSTSEISATVKSQVFTGVSVLSINVLGSVAQNNAANGTQVRALVVGY